MMCVNCQTDQPIQTGTVCLHCLTTWHAPIAGTSVLVAPTAPGNVLIFPGPKVVTTLDPPAVLPPVPAAGPSGVVSHVEVAIAEPGTLSLHLVTVDEHGNIFRVDGSAPMGDVLELPRAAFIDRYTMPAIAAILYKWREGRS